MTVRVFEVPAFDVDLSDVDGIERADSVPVLDEAIVEILGAVETAGCSRLAVRLVELLRDAVEFGVDTEDEQDGLREDASDEGGSP